MVFSLVGTKGIRLWLFCSFARVRLIFAWDNFFLHFLHKTGWLQSSISGDAEEMLAIIIKSERLNISPEGSVSLDA